jgi:hypothetical protein
MIALGGTGRRYLEGLKHFFKDEVNPLNQKSDAQLSPTHFIMFFFVT